MSNRNKKLSPILHKRLTQIPQFPAHNQSRNQRQSNLFQYQKMQRKIRQKRRSLSNNTQYIIVRSEAQQQLMNNLKPKVTPLLSPTNSISISKNLKLKDKQKRSKSTFLHHEVEPIKPKNTELDNILQSKQKFMSTYFGQLKQFKKRPPQVKQKQEVSYQFPQVKVNGWRVRGFLRGRFVLLKGIKNQDNYLPPKQKFKKYPYAAAWSKIRQNYEQWVDDKFIFQD